MLITDSSGTARLLAGLSGALSVGLWVMLAAVLALGGGYVVVAVKRWVQREEPPETFTLQDLREMRARHDITEQEYATLRAELLDRVAGASPSSPADGPDRFSSPDSTAPSDSDA